jgi:glycolate oxidase FAD binding subunit
MKPLTVDELQAIVRAHPRVLPRGGGTKPALSTARDGAAAIDLTALAGLLEYEPSEFVFTARAGTRLSAVRAQLTEHGQHLPFDPLLVDAGATLGGTIAAGANGPGRYRYGGVRDFLLGVRFVNGAGESVYAGGKVVKNSAGFDIPKLMVGSLGQLGILVEVSFKVFPQPEAHVTVRLDCATLSEALAVVQRLYTSPLDIDSFDLEPTASGTIVWLRLAGLQSALPRRIDRVRGTIGGGEVIDDDEALWRNVRELKWLPEGWSLIKVPVTPKRIPTLDQALPAVGSSTALRRYSSGGQAAWIALADRAESLEPILIAQELSGLVLIGATDRSRLGVRAGEPFERRVKQALDPQGRFSGAALAIDAAGGR